MKVEKYNAATYVDSNDELHVGADVSKVMVLNEGQRAVVAASFGPGIFAYLPGLEKVWQLKDDGTWAEFSQIGR